MEGEKKSGLFVALPCSVCRFVSSVCRFKHVFTLSLYLVFLFLTSRTFVKVVWLFWDGFGFAKYI